ncbi:hypothetical protein IFM89_019052 [Coptis chinensis]|uniref:Uncharacterized protein n=1 Tax=Coptis chinensis TaxID=261450 RepID=A0A835MCZ6_9MAGN|nr:hypothetical protein IFM89_019052 [Coptis chinensis]
MGKDDMVFHEKGMDDGRVESLHAVMKITVVCLFGYGEIVLPVSRVMYYALVRIISFSANREKKEHMLAKKVESTVTKAMDVETKKMRMEVAAMEKKVASIRVEKDDEKRAK